jgi:excisionase family DNA binding protein
MAESKLDRSPEDEDDSNEFYKVSEVAQMLKVSKRTVLNWIDDGSLLAFRPSPGIIRIAKKDYDAFVAISMR